MLQKKLKPFAIALLVFIVVSLAYFAPVLEGKKLFQSDIAQFIGMSKEVKDFRANYGEEPFWTNRAFGGMPTFQLSTYYPHDYVKKLDSLLRFLPRPADYLFLYFLGFFILLKSLNTEWRLAIMGALGFGFSTYLIIILGVGHNAKAHAIAYMPMVLAGILLVFRERYFAGFLLTAIAMALEIQASHPQMTYYLLFMVLIYGLFELIKAVQDKSIMPMAKKLGLLVVAVVLAIGVNATSLLATQEYAKESTRSASELTLNPDGSPKEQSTGLSRYYITEYSFGILESFDLLIPRFMGGSNNENLGKDSKTYEYLKDKAGRQQALAFAENAPMYWGDQPIVAAPPYIGAVFIFLFVIGIFLVEAKMRNWLLGVTLFSLALSWGKNFGLLTDFFIDYVPLYNKFRAVSSIQVLAEIAVPLMGVLALSKLLDPKEDPKRKMEALKKAAWGIGGLTLFFTAFGSYLFSFESYRDPSFEQMLGGLVDVLIEDRRTIFFQDSLRSMIFVTMAFCVLYLFITKKIKSSAVVWSFMALIVVDLVFVDRRYVNEEDFIRADRVEKPFELSQAKAMIQEDKGHFRVMNFTVNPMNDGSTSYFFNSIGGYHAAKPRRYQELFEHQIAKNNVETLNMLNTKYFLFPDEQGQEQVQLNSDANGNAWFVRALIPVETADEEMRALDSIKSKEQLVYRVDLLKAQPKLAAVQDSLASIELTSYKANEMIYRSVSQADQVAVFSEIYYPHGWKAFIDGQQAEIFRGNYVLRALEVPAGEHEIRFVYEPEVIATGSRISLVSYAFMLGIPLFWFLYDKKRKQSDGAV